MAPAPDRDARPARARIRDLAPYVRPHRWALLGGMLLGLGATGVALVQPLAAQRVLEAVTADEGGVRGPVVLLLVLMALGAALGAAQGVLLGRTAERVVLRARARLVDRLLRLRMTDLSSRPAGDLVARVTSDATLLRAAATTSIVEGVNGVIGLVGAVILMALLDVLLLGVTLSALALVAGALVVTLPRAGAASRRSQEAVGAVGAALDEALRGIRTVKAAGGEEREARRVGDAATEAYRQGTRAVVLNTLGSVAAGAGLQLAFLAVLGAGAWRVSEGALELPGLVAFLLYLFFLGGPISSITGAATGLQQGLAAVARMRELEGLGTERGGVAHASPPEPGEPLVRMRGVRVRYGDAAPALDGIDLDLPRTGHTALVGPSGAGKTTLVAAILRFVEPEEGAILLDGVPVADWPLHELRRRAAYVEQDAPLLPGSLEENLRYSAPDATEDEVGEVVHRLRLGGLVARLPGGLASSPLSTTISGGERQRIAIARALLRRPELLLLDEVTAQLDALAEAAVTGAIAEAARDRAVLTIAHRLSTVVAADRILVLEDGRIRAAGTHAELMDVDELYRTLVRTTLLPLAAAGSSEAVT